MIRSLTLASIVALAGTAHAQFATINGAGNVAGNTNAGFGGVIGTGSLDLITLADGSVSLTINRGGADFNDAAVVYIDTGVGGITNTSILTDTADDGRRAISGGTNSDLGFAAGFSPAFAVSYQTSFAGLFSIGADPANHGFVAGVGGGTNSNDASFPINFNLADIGLAAGDSFRVLVTYLNAGNAYRSGEFIGTADTGPFADGANIGNNAHTLSADSYILVNSIPTPASAAILAFAGLAAARRRR